MKTSQKQHKELIIIAMHNALIISVNLEITNHHAVNKLTSVSEVKRRGYALSLNVS